MRISNRVDLTYMIWLYLQFELYPLVISRIFTSCIIETQFISKKKFEMISQFLASSLQKQYVIWWVYTIIINYYKKFLVK